MPPNPDTTEFSSSYNAFKNNSVQRGNLKLPVSMIADQVYTDTLNFTLSQPASFLQAYMFNTDYTSYFDYLDSQYHDNWRLVHTNQDNLLLTDLSLINYYVRMQLNSTTVSFTLRIKNISSATNTIHPTMLVPITFIDYTLAN